MRQRGRAPQPPQDESESESESEFEVPSPKKNAAGAVAVGGGSSKTSELFKRSAGTFVMCFLFMAVQHIGQTLGILLVVTCQFMMFKEILKIGERKNMEKEVPTMKFLSWYMFLVCTVTTAIYFLRLPLVQTWPSLEGHLRHTMFAAYTLYLSGIVFFVLSLKPVNISLPGFRRKSAKPQTGPPKQIYFRYQFAQFAWLHMGLLAFGVMSSFFYAIMMEGMIWWTLPVSCIVHNDSWAFACGKLFGSVPLIPTLSPKKTWEGFLGAWFFTTAWAFWYADVLSSHKRFICPKTNFLTAIDCEVASAFLPQAYALPSLIADVVGVSEVVLKPVQIHGMAFAAFSSTFAPFGGFFASGLKRAFNLKDFGDLIPGHGGMIDRMDCQILMALFVYVYYYQFVYEQGGVCVGVTAALQSTCLTRMPEETLVALYNSLGEQLTKSVWGTQLTRD